MKKPEDLKALSLEEAQKHSIVLEARIDELKELSKSATSLQGMLDAKEELKVLEAEKIELDGIIAEVTVEETPEAVEETVEEASTEEEVVAETTEPVAEETQETTETTAEATEEVVADETVETVEPEKAETPAELEVEVDTTQVQEAIAASLTTGDTVDINEPSETTTPKSHITASFSPIVDGAKDEMDAIERIKRRPAGGDAFKTVYEGESVVKLETMNAASMTDFVMALGTPGRPDEYTRAQKQYAMNKGTVAAAFCQPPQLLDSDIQCGSYNPVIFNMLPNFLMDGLEFEFYSPVDSSDPDFVGEVDLVDDSGDPLDSIAEKACYELECLTRTSYKAREIKACLTANEQTAFTAPQAIQALLADGVALLAATRDQALLDWIISETFKFSYTAADAGYAEIALTIAMAMEDLDRQSAITQVDDLVGLAPKSLFRYAVADNALRQFSLQDAQEAANSLFSGLGLRDIVVYDDALDSTNATPVPTLSKTVATALVPRNDWSIHLINPAEALVGLHSENEYSLEKVPQSITEKRGNTHSWFARNYFAPGRRGCDGWATIDISNICLGGRVVAGQACIG